MKFSACMGNQDQITSAESNLAPPPSPCFTVWASQSFEFFRNGWRAKETKRQKGKKKQKGKKEKKSKNISQRMAATGGIDLEKLDQRDPEMASLVQKLLEQEEKDEGELEGEVLYNLLFWLLFLFTAVCNQAMRCPLH